MVRPQELVEAVLYSLEESGELPERTTFVGYTPDINTEALKLPVVEVSLNAKTEIGESNSDLVGYQTNDADERVGRIYEQLYTQQLAVAAWTAQGSRYSPREMSDSIRTALYKFETAGPNKPLIHPDIGELSEIWTFHMQSGTQTDDLSTSAPLRRWEETLVINASEQYIDQDVSVPIARTNEDVQTQ